MKVLALLYLLDPRAHAFELHEMCNLIMELAVKPEQGAPRTVEEIQKKIARERRRDRIEGLASECFSGGMCGPVALQNVTKQSPEKVLGELTKQIKTHGQREVGQSGASQLDLANYLYNHAPPDLVYIKDKEVTDRREVQRVLLEEAMAESQGDYAYFVQISGAMPHVESVYRGEISNELRFVDPDHPEAGKGSLEEPIEQRKEYLKEMLRRVGNSPVTVVRYRVKPFLGTRR